MKIPQLENFLVGRKIQINEEERVISDLPESVVGNCAFPVVLRTFMNALVQHAERRLELPRENGLYMFNHGNHSHWVMLSTRPPNVGVQPAGPETKVG